MMGGRFDTSILELTGEGIEIPSPGMGMYLNNLVVEIFECGAIQGKVVLYGDLQGRGCVLIFLSHYTENCMFQFA